MLGNHAGGDPMKNARTKRFRLLVVLLGFVLLAAACAAAAPDPPLADDDDIPVEDEIPVEDDTPVEDDAPVEDEIPVQEDPPVEEDPTVEEDPPVEPAGPVMLVLTPDPFGTDDPLETINHLQSVDVSRTDTGVAVQFNQMNNGGLRVTIEDRAANVDVNCDIYDAGDGTLASTCSGYNFGTGEFLPAEDIPLLDIPDGYAADIPLTLDENLVSVVLGGTTYSAPRLRIADEPGFVQIDPNTGLLSAPVVREVGYVTAGDLLAALG
jgi:hypothetical protein